MTLNPGARLGVYEVRSALGAGGMGEVYRARDTRLGRDVAIKVLPEAFARDSERLARLEREARALAALNHSNIGAIYAQEELRDPASAQSNLALVLELVEGPTLAEKLARGPRLPVSEALNIARQLADALAAAHEQGIIHRDLKPANIKVREDGTVKVLDFGLARLVEPGGASDDRQAVANVWESATLTSPALLTGVGMLLGTAAYMAPEQAKGRPADWRSDMWAFGCVLYEMLAGTRPFDGSDVTDVLGAVVRLDPDWTAVPADVPPAVRTLLRTCLAKDRQARKVSAVTALFVLDNAASLTMEVETAGGRGTNAPLWRRALPIVAVTVVTAAVVGYAAWTLRPEPARPIARFVITLPDGEQFTSLGRHSVAVSPSGSHIAYSAGERLNVRALDRLASTPVRGTEGSGPGAGRNPFFSPDGQWIGFWQSGQLKKFSVTGGAPVVLCAAGTPFGASWGDGDTILVGQGPEGIMRVAGTGGTPEVLLTVGEGESAHGPQMLPGNRAILFTLKPRGAESWDDSQIVVQALDSRSHKVLINGGTDARYVSTEHLVYALAGTLLAVPFDPDALELTGLAAPLVDGVARSPSTGSGAAHFSVSARGMLVYIPDTIRPLQRTLVWVDRQGREEPIPAPARGYLRPRLSPDGQRVAVDTADEQHDVWIWSFSHKTLTRLTFGESLEFGPVWTPDGRRVIFSSGRVHPYNLFWQPADGTGSVERLTKSQYPEIPHSVSRDGVLVFGRGAQTGTLMRMPLQGERRVEAMLQTASAEGSSEISPNGGWLTYQSNESGRDEIYVRPFPNVNDGSWQISTGGGTHPLWAPSGQELFYLTPSDHALMSVAIPPGPVFRHGNPTKLFDATLYAATAIDGWKPAISPDGRRFLMTKPVAADQASAPAAIVVVENWFEELERRVPRR